MTVRATRLARLIAVLVLSACVVAAIATRSVALGVNACLIGGVLTFGRWAARDAARIGYDSYRAEGWVLVLGYLGPVWWLVRRSRLRS